MKAKQITLQEMIDDIEELDTNPQGEYTVWVHNKVTGELTRIDDVEDLEFLSSTPPVINYEYNND